LRSIRWSRAAALALYVVCGTRAATAQPNSAGSATVELEEDVEVVATPPASPAENAPAAQPAQPAAAPGVEAPGEPTPAATAPAVTPAPAAQPADAPAVTTPAAESGDDHKAKLAALEERLAALEATRAASGSSGQRAAMPDEEAARLSNSTPIEAWLGLQWSAFIQAQYTSSQLSEDQLFPGGEPRNQDGFVIRRARLRMQRAWQYAGVDMELDASTVRGFDLGARRLAGFVFYNNSALSNVPVVRLSAGLLDIPFGYELPAGARARLFGERSAASQAFFPIEADVGAAVDGGLGPLRYTVAVMNGLEAEERYRLRDVNKHKDLLLRVGVDVAPIEIVRVLAGVSFLNGQGFHPGGEPTKNDLQWNDINEDGSKTDAEVAGVPGSAADPSRNFHRWAVGLDARVGVLSDIGWSWLYGEVTVAQNLDRGRFVADPIAASLDLRELGYAIAFTQDIAQYFSVGFRTDFYDGNSDFIERRRNRAFQQPQTIRTFSPVVAVVLPGYARLSFQYDIVRDTFGRDQRGEPANLKNNAWTVRLQVGL
jgi:hypothetical protein